jgi:hypothetical protein
MISRQRPHQLAVKPNRLLTSKRPEVLVNDRSLLDLFFTVVVFFTGYSLVFIVFLQLLHLAISLIFVASASGAGTYQGPETNSHPD